MYKIETLKSLRIIIIRIWHRRIMRIWLKNSKNWLWFKLLSKCQRANLLYSQNNFSWSRSFPFNVSVVFLCRCFLWGFFCHLFNSWALLIWAQSSCLSCWFWLQQIHVCPPSAVNAMWELTFSFFKVFTSKLNIHNLLWNLKKTTHGCWCEFSTLF